MSAAVALSALLLVAFATHVSAVTIPTVPVGNAGNAGELSGTGAGGFGPDAIVGGVAQDYRIGTTEVSNAQYAAFLNAKAESDPLDLYNAPMGSGLGGITRSGSSGSYSYTTISGRGNMPVNFVSWYDSIRFANWLNNGQGSGDTETGAYTLLGGTPTPSNGLSITRNTGATWFLTSEDEWYKAAYYDGSSYFDYPTSSNTAPTAVAPAGGSNSANYLFFIGDLTDVGAYTGSASPFGTLDQGGNVWEWNEALLSGSFRGQRGGSFNNNSNFLLASARGILNPTLENVSVGFRVATVPEPSMAVLAVVGCVLMLWWRRRK